MVPDRLEAFDEVKPAHEWLGSLFCTIAHPDFWASASGL